MIPTVAPPGQLGGMTTEESEPGMRAIAGPTWRNEITARAVFGEWTNRGITRMEKLGCPILIQIADRDSVAPSAAARTSTTPPCSAASARRAPSRISSR